MTQVQIIFANNLKRLRKKHHLTQASFAEPLGVSTTFIGQLEVCTRAPSIEFIQKVVDTYRIEASELFSPSEALDQKTSEAMKPKESTQELHAALLSVVTKMVDELVEIIDETKNQEK